MEIRARPPVQHLGAFIRVGPVTQRPVQVAVVRVWVPVERIRRTRLVMWEMATGLVGARQHRQPLLMVSSAKVSSGDLMAESVLNCASNNFRHAPPKLVGHGLSSVRPACTGRVSPCWWVPQIPAAACSAAIEPAAEEV